MNLSHVRACNRCGIEKPETAFSADRRGPGGRNYRCKECVAEHSRAWRKANPEKKLAETRAYRAANAERVAANAKAYRAANQEHLKALSCQSAKRWLESNPEQRKAHVRAYAEKHRDRPDRLLRKRISAGLRAALRGGKAWRSSESLLGYTIADLREHLGRQFLKGMSWENMGKWHIDHIVPVSAFEITSVDDPIVRRVWALSNLRPLWARDNMSKNARVDHLL